MGPIRPHATPRWHHTPPLQVSSSPRHYQILDCDKTATFIWIIIIIIIIIICTGFQTELKTCANKSHLTRDDDQQAISKYDPSNQYNFYKIFSRQKLSIFLLWEFWIIPIAPIAVRKEVSESWANGKVSPINPHTAIKYPTET